jgi:uncharacterized SAM-binding protein YcdF (DUF218 family)/beta-phosphoglucomutase-like phosphatase (HAD superfamily)
MRIIVLRRFIRAVCLFIISSLIIQSIEVSFGYQVIEVAAYRNGVFISRRPCETRIETVLDEQALSARLIESPEHIISPFVRERQTVTRNTSGLLQLIRKTVPLSRRVNDRFPPDRRADLILGIGAGFKNDGGPSNLSIAVAEKCAALVREGVAPRIMLSGGSIVRGASEEEKMRDVLNEMGIMRDIVLARAPNRSASSHLMPEYVARAFGEHWPQRVIIVAHPLHLPRVLWLFEHAFPEIEFYPVNAREAYDPESNQLRLHNSFWFTVWNGLAFCHHRMFPPKRADVSHLAARIEARSDDVIGSVGRAGPHLKVTASVWSKSGVLTGFVAPLDTFGNPLKDKSKFLPVELTYDAPTSDEMVRLQEHLQTIRWALEDTLASPSKMPELYRTLITAFSNNLPEFNLQCVSILRGPPLLDSEGRQLLLGCATKDQIFLHGSMLRSPVWLLHEMLEQFLGNQLPSRNGKVTLSCQTPAGKSFKVRVSAHKLARGFGHRARESLTDNTPTLTREDRILKKLGDTYGRGLQGWLSFRRFLLDGVEFHNDRGTQFVEEDNLHNLVDEHSAVLVEPHPDDIALNMGAMAQAYAGVVGSGDEGRLSMVTITWDPEGVRDEWVYHLLTGKSLSNPLTPKDKAKLENLKQRIKPDAWRQFKRHVRFDEGLAGAQCLIGSMRAADGQYESFGLDLEVVDRVVRPSNGKFLSYVSKFRSPVQEEFERVERYVERHNDAKFFFLPSPFDRHQHHFDVTRMFLPAIARHAPKARVIFYESMRGFNDENLMPNLLYFFGVGGHEQKLANIKTSFGSQMERNDYDAQLRQLAHQRAFLETSISSWGLSKEADDAERFVSGTVRFHVNHLQLIGNAAKGPIESPDKQFSAPDTVLVIPLELEDFSEQNIGLVMLSKTSGVVFTDEKASQTIKLGMRTRLAALLEHAAGGMGVGRDLVVRLVVTRDIPEINGRRGSMAYDQATNTFYVHPVMLTETVPLDYAMLVADHELIAHAYMGLGEEAAQDFSARSASQSRDVLQAVVSLLSSACPVVIDPSFLRLILAAAPPDAYPDLLGRLRNLAPLPVKLLAIDWTETIVNFDPQTKIKTLIPGAVKLLRKLRAVGIKVRIVTTNEAEDTKKTLSQFIRDGLMEDGLIDGVLGGPKGKKDHLKALIGQGFKVDEMVMLGDHPNDMRDAEASGVARIGINRDPAQTEEFQRHSPAALISGLEDTENVVAQILGAPARQKAANLSDLVDKALEIHSHEERTGLLRAKISEITADKYFTEKGIAYLPAKSGRLIVIGDLHGDLSTLERLLNQAGYTSEGNSKASDPVYLVFAGDYADRGTQSLAVALKVMQMKVSDPDHVILLAGNHDLFGSAVVHAAVGHGERIFMDELIGQLGPTKGQSLYNKWFGLMETAPTLLVTASGITVCHAAPPSTKAGFDADASHPGLLSIANDDFQRRQLANNPIRLPANAGEEEYGDVINGADEMHETIMDRPGYYWIGRQGIETFLKAVGGHILVRGHDATAPADKSFFDHRVLTVISTDYRSHDHGYPVGKEIVGRYAEFDLSRNYDQIDPAQVVRYSWSGEIKTRSGQALGSYEVREWNPGGRGAWVPYAVLRFHPEDGMTAAISVDSELDGKLHPVDRRFNYAVYKDGDNELPGHPAIHEQKIKSVQWHLQNLGLRFGGERIVAASVGNEDLFWDKGVVTYNGGKFYHNIGEDVRTRAYPMLVVWKNGRITIEPDVKFDSLGEEGYARVLIGGSDRTEDIEDATFVQLIKDERGFVDPADNSDWYSDLRHLFSVPALRHADFPDIPPDDELMSGAINFGMDQLNTGDRRTNVHSAASGPVTLDLTVRYKSRDGNPGEFQLTPDELRPKLAQLDYVEVPGRPQNRGEFHFISDGRRVEICLLENHYPFNMVGITKQGEFVNVLMGGLSGRAGPTIKEAYEMAKQLGLERAGIVDQGGSVRLLVGDQSIITPNRSAKSTSIIAYTVPLAVMDGLGEVIPAIKAAWDEELRASIFNANHKKIVSAFNADVRAIQFKKVGGYVAGLTPFVQQGTDKVKSSPPGSFDFRNIPARAKLFAINLAGKLGLVAFTNEPGLLYHTLIIPDINNENLPASPVTAEALRGMLKIQKSPEGRNVRFFSNSLHGWAMVNHLHFHVFPMDQVEDYLTDSDLPMEKGGLERVAESDGVVISRLTGYSGRAAVFSGSNIEKLTEEAAQFARFLDRKGIAHHVIISKGIIYIIPRRVSASMGSERWERKIGALEFAGIILLNRKEDYDDITPDQIAEEIEDSSYSEAWLKDTLDDYLASRRLGWVNFRAEADLRGWGGRVPGIQLFIDQNPSHLLIRNPAGKPVLNKSDLDVDIQVMLGSHTLYEGKETLQIPAALADQLERQPEMAECLLSYHRSVEAGSSASPDERLQDFARQAAWEYYQAWRLAQDKVAAGEGITEMNLSVPRAHLGGNKVDILNLQYTVPQDSEVGQNLAKLITDFKTALAREGIADKVELIDSSHLHMSIGGVARKKSFTDTDENRFREAALDVTGEKPQSRIEFGRVYFYAPAAAICLLAQPKDGGAVRAMARQLHEEFIGGQPLNNFHITLGYLREPMSPKEYRSFMAIIDRFRDTLFGMVKMEELEAIRLRGVLDTPRPLGVYKLGTTYRIQATAFPVLGTGVVGREPTSIPQKVRQAGRILRGYLAVQEKLSDDIDGIVIFGNDLLAVPIKIADLYGRLKNKPWIIVSGKTGRGTRKEWRVVNKTEAEGIHDILVDSGVSNDKIYLEKDATNTGLNAKKSLGIMVDKGLDRKKVIVVQTPMQQLRAGLTAAQEYGADTEVINWVPFIPAFDRVPDGEWSRAEWNRRILWDAAGEVFRIIDYPWQGFMKEPYLDNAQWSELLQAAIVVGEFLLKDFSIPETERRKLQSIWLPTIVETLASGSLGENRIPASCGTPSPMVLKRAA